MGVAIITGADNAPGARLGPGQLALRRRDESARAAA